MQPNIPAFVELSRTQQTLFTREEVTKKPKTPIERPSESARSNGEHTFEQYKIILLDNY